VQAVAEWFKAVLRLRIAATSIPVYVTGWYILYIGSSDRFTKSVERGVQGVPQVLGPDFSGGPEILEIPHVIFMQK